MHNNAFPTKLNGKSTEQHLLTYSFLLSPFPSTSLGACGESGVLGGGSRNRRNMGVRKNLITKTAVFKVNLENLKIEE